MSSSRAPPPQAWQSRAVEAFPVGGGQGTQVAQASAALFRHWLGMVGQPDCKNVKRGLSPASPPSQPQFSFSSLPPPPLPLLFTLPKYAQAVIMGLESSHTDIQPAPVSLPPASHRAALQSPLLPWANESQMAACESATACGNPDGLPSHAPHSASVAPADRRDLLL